MVSPTNNPVVIVAIKVLGIKLLTAESIEEVPS
jgi:hypothetical protein